MFNGAIAEIVSVFYHGFSLRRVMSLEASYHSISTIIRDSIMSRVRAPGPSIRGAPRAGQVAESEVEEIWKFCKGR